MIQTIKKAFPVGFLAVSLFAMMLLIACSSDTTEPAPAPTTAPAAAPTAVAPAAAPTAAPTPEPEPLTVVTTMSITADWISNVGGDRVNVISLLPVGADPHLYQPTPRDVATVAEADLILPVGLRLEASWLDDLLHTAAADESAIVDMGELIDPLPFEEQHGMEMHGMEGGESLADAILHVVHEVEDGHISAHDALHEIEELIEAAAEEEGHDHAGHGHGEEEDWDHEILEIIEMAESGDLDAAMAIVEIDHIALEEAGHHDEHDDHGEALAKEILHVVHEGEDGHISAEEGVHEIEELMEAAEEEEGHDHEEEWEHEIHEIIEQAESGNFDAMMAIEEIDHIALEVVGDHHDDHEDEHDEDEDEHEDHGHDDHGHDDHGHDPWRVRPALLARPRSGAGCLDRHRESSVCA